MGSTHDVPGQKHFSFESPETRRAQGTLDDFDLLQGDSLVAALVANGIFVDRTEMEQEFSMGQDRCSSDFGGQYTFDEYLRSGRNDWKCMIQSIANGDAANGKAARALLYEGRDNISHIRRNRIMRNTPQEVRNILDRPKPR